jgi:selenophosphate synthetase-related protein
MHVGIAWLTVFFSYIYLSTFLPFEMKTIARILNHFEMTAEVEFTVVKRRGKTIAQIFKHFEMITGLKM